MAATPPSKAVIELVERFDRERNDFQFGKPRDSGASLIPAHAALARCEIMRERF
jgi:hypothetical protein